ncbi:MAG: DUF1501 domain-containing protein [Planctomycetota bacterium]
MRRDSLSRRKFLKGAALGAAAVTIQPILCSRHLYAASVGTPGRFVVVVNCLGGSDGLNCVIPAHLQPYVDRRPNINLADTANLPAGASLHDLDGNNKLHYSLASLKQLWDESNLHIVQKVSYPSPNQSHFTSMDIMSYGIRNNEADGDGRGWLGRFADTYCANPVEPLGVIAVGVGRRRDFESDVTAPLILNNVQSFVVDGDGDPGQDAELRHRVITDTLATDPVPPNDPALTIFQTNKSAYELVEQVQAETAGWTDPGTYPTTTLGQRMRTISQLLHAHASFGTKVFYTAFPGFDTHSAQHSPGGDSRHEQLMEQLDGALGAFADDMKAKAMWNNAVIIVISEFGRRVFENGSVGTDHGWGNAWLVAGGRVKGESVAGGMTGEILESDLAPPNNNLPWGEDFRDIYVNLMTNHLGLSSPEQLFPDPGYVPSSGDLDLVF